MLRSWPPLGDVRQDRLFNLRAPKSERLATLRPHIHSMSQVGSMSLTSKSPPQMRVEVEIVAFYRTKQPL